MRLLKRLSRIFSFCLLSLQFALHSSLAADSETAKDEKAGFLSFQYRRERMVARQIQARGIRSESVLETMRKVERHRFVPLPLRPVAYEDTPLPIGFGQTISQPYIVAFMTEVLSLRGHERVLEIGTGSGYQAAVLAELAAQIYTIEILPPLAERAKKVLEELGYQNIQARQGDGYAGWAEEAPFDAIIVTAAPPEIPEALVGQLKNGGRMIVPVGAGSQDLLLITKTEKGIEKERLLPVRFVPMVRGDIPKLPEGDS